MSGCKGVPQSVAAVSLFNATTQFQRIEFNYLESCMPRLPKPRFLPLLWVGCLGKGWRRV